MTLLMRTWTTMVGLFFVSRSCREREASGGQKSLVQRSDVPLAFSNKKKSAIPNLKEGLVSRQDRSTYLGKLGTSGLLTGDARPSRGWRGRVQRYHRYVSYLPELLCGQYFFTPG